MRRRSPPSRASRRSRRRRRSPASSSCWQVPSSKRWPTGSSAAGRTLYGRQLREQLLAPERHPHVRPEELVRRADEHVARPTRRRRSGRAGRSGRRRPRRARRPRGRARRSAGRRAPCPPSSRRRGRRRRASGRSSCRAEVVVVEREIVVRRRRSGRRCRGPPASASHGATLRVVVELRHEHLVARRRARARSARVSRKLSEVMLCPNATSPGVAAEERGRPLVREVDERRRARATSRTARRCWRCRWRR